MKAILSLAAATLIFAAITKFFGRKRCPESLRITLGISKEAVFKLRKKLTCKALSISYENTEPLMMVMARGQYLFDEMGRKYLDTRNNVAHVGHCHPEVIEAISYQAEMINTNTRYLHPNLVLLAEKLLATFPKGSSLANDGVVFFVNSGSEANDLALRLAYTHTQHKNMIVVERAYHGHTVADIQISPYKFEHPKSVGQQAFVQKVPCPDVYRGEHQGSDAALRYSNYVKEACLRAKGEGGLAGFFIESGMSVAGVILPPENYLRYCYEHVHAAGGVCIADEVQTGLGRFGKYWWGFEQQDVVPDIVTVGKPFGNGMPLAAVICSKEISASFAEGPEYFNTFGGNPVTCAAGLAVLHVIEKENLLLHASAVGCYLKQKLDDLRAEAHGALIGDVRGSGLFVGIEFVSNRQTKTPATAETSWICSRLKDEHLILTSIDGPHHNVLVLKPPMCFSTDDVDFFIDALQAQLAQCKYQDFTKVGHTPT